MIFDCLANSLSHFFKFSGPTNEPIQCDNLNESKPFEQSIRIVEQGQRDFPGTQNHQQDHAVVNVSF